MAARSRPAKHSALSLSFRPKMNADRAEAELAKRAALERWALGEFLQELRRYFPEVAPAPLPPEPTDRIPGTLEKNQVMEKRVEQGFAACHPCDPRIENGFLILTGTGNDNGSDTEMECRDEVEVRQERTKNKNDCDPAMTERLARIDAILARMRTRRGS